ncbi:MAG: hypothetical protein KatS3mg039_0337 [Candidatus Kapaibacterium sp.]|nr:MAG: hypothetical protein KatS3mg039_0337 [Candidatus Kapabacteria bacterium]
MYRRLLSIALLLIGACRSTESLPCTLPADLRIRWGTWNDSLGVLDGYQLEPNGTVVRYRQSTQSATISTLDTLPVSIESTVRCSVATSLRDAFLQNQTYVVIGPLSHYVEYATATATMRAVWDARYQTYGSRHFRAIFRWLNHLIGSDESPDR